MKGESYYLVRSGPGQWRAVRPDDQKNEFQEIERNQTSIQLQNVKTKLFLRLESDFGYWRRPKDEQWTRWVTGGWLSESEIPQHVRSQVSDTSGTDESLTESPSAPLPSDTNATVPERPKEAPPTTESYRIRLVYFVPQDRQPAREYEKKIGVIMSIIASVIHDDLTRKGYKADGLKFEAEDGRPVIHLVKGQHQASHYNDAPNYDGNRQVRNIMPEVREAVGNPFENLLVVFTETYDHGPAKVLWPGVVARGAYYSVRGGIAVYSSHLLQDGFCGTTLTAQRRLLFDTTPVPGRATFGHRRPGAPRCDFIEDGMGALMHELGHALGLPHDQRRDDIFVMGNGFRNLRWNYTREPRGRRVGFSDDNARLLMSSRFLNPALNHSDHQAPKVSIELSQEAGKPPQLSVRLQDDVGLHAMVYFDTHVGSVVGGRALEGKEAAFQDPVPPSIVHNGQLGIEVFVADNGGNLTRLKKELSLGG